MRDEVGLMASDAVRMTAFLMARNAHRQGADARRRNLTVRRVRMVRIKPAIGGY